MPEGIEYLHCVQAALDASGLRCQVLDTSGQIREWLAWPLMLPPSTEWPQLACGNNAAPVDEDRTADATLGRVLVWHFAAICSPVSNAEAQTLLCGWDTGPTLASLWIGLQGREHRLGVLLSPARDAAHTYG